MPGLNRNGLAFLSCALMVASASAQDTVKVRGIEYRDAIELRGATVRGYQVTQISAKLGGYVKQIGKVGELDIDVGSRVKSGQVLAVLDIPEMKDELAQRLAAVEQARSLEVQARAHVAEANAKVSQKKAALLQVQAGIAKKKATLKLTEARLKRVSMLAKRGSISQDNLDEARFEVDAARASLSTIEADIEAAQADITAAEATVERAKADIVSARAEQKAAAADVDRTKTMMEYTVIKAPYNGLITKRMVDLGTFVQPAQNNSAAMPMFEITQVDRIRLVVAVPNNKVGGIAIGQKVRFDSIGGLEGRRFEGTITRTAGALDRKTRTLNVEADMANPAKDVVSGKPVELKPGLYGTMTVVRNQWTGDSKLPVVPTTAVRTDQNGRRYVMVMRNGKAVRQIVTIAFNNAADVGISSGIRAGDEVLKSAR